MKLSTVAGVAALLWSASWTAAAEPAEAPSDEAAVTAKVEGLLAQMTLEEKTWAGRADSARMECAPASPRR